jgi:hypothetical protein
MKAITQNIIEKIMKSPILQKTNSTKTHMLIPLTTKKITKNREIDCTTWELGDAQ